MLSVTAIKFKNINIGRAEDRKRITLKDALRTSAHPISVALT